MYYYLDDGSYTAWGGDESQWVGIETELYRIVYLILIYSYLPKNDSYRVVWHDETGKF